MQTSFAIHRYRQAHYQGNTLALQNLLARIVGLQRHLSDSDLKLSEETIELHRLALEQCAKLLQKREYLLQLNPSQHKKLSQLLLILDKSIFSRLRPLIGRDNSDEQNLEVKNILNVFFETYKSYLILRKQQSDIFSILEMKLEFKKSQFTNHL